MKKTIHKLLSLLLVFTMVLGFFPALAVHTHAETVSNTCGASINWTLEDGVLTLTGTGQTTKYALSNGVPNHPWVAYTETIEEIVVGEGITGLEDCLFYGLSAVEKVTLPKSLTRIATRVFKNCTALERLTINSQLSLLGYEALTGSGITDLYFTASAPTGWGGKTPFAADHTYDLHIPCNDETFTDTVLTKLSGVATKVLVHDYKNGACADCGAADPSVRTGTFAAGAAWSYADGLLTISKTDAGAVTDNYEVSHLSDASKYPFYDFASEVTEVVVEEGVTKLGKCLLLGMANLEKVTLPASLTHIETRVFKNCAKLTELTVPGNLSLLGLEALVGSGITDLYFGGNAPTTISGTKPCTGLTYNVHVLCNNATWTDAILTKMGGTPTKAPVHDYQEGTCSRCGEADPSAPPTPSVRTGTFTAGAAWSYADGVLTISKTDAGTATDNYEVSHISDITKYPFYEFVSEVTEVVVEEGVTKLGKCVLYAMPNLEKVTLPASLTHIETRVFKNCAKLTELTVPGNLSLLGLEALVGSGITDLYFGGNAPTTISGTKPCTGLTYNVHVLCNNATWTDAILTKMGGTPTKAPVHDYQEGACSRCGEADPSVPPTPSVLTGTCGASINWTLENGVLTLTGTGATTEYTYTAATDTANTPWWEHRESVTKIVVGEGITNLDNYVFYGCTNVTEVTLPTTLQRIETRVFKKYTKLTELTINSNLVWLGLEAMAGSGITDLYFTGDAPAGCSGTKPCTGLTYNIHVRCNNETWTDAKLTAMGGTPTLVLQHSWEGSTCTGCGASQNVPVASVTLDKTTAEITLADQLTLVATVSPDNAADKSLTWTSSDETVATVSGGVVTPLKGGTVTITATANDGSGKSASCTVTISDEDLGGTCGSKITWTLVDGVLTLTGTGSTTEFTRTSATDTVNTPWWNVRETVTEIVVGEGITVLDNYVFYGMSNVTSVTLPSTLTRLETRIFSGCTQLTQLTISASGIYLGYEAFANSGIKDLYFTGGVYGTSSSTPPCNKLTYNLHTVCTADGWTAAKIGAMGGTATQVVEHAWVGNVCDRCGAKTGTLVTGIQLKPDTVSIFANSTYPINAVVSPSDASDTSLTWTSDNEAVATVSPVGVVTGVAPGTANITATAKDGSGVQATCVVTVKEGIGGTCGPNAEWSFKDGVLVITGSGALTKFTRNVQNDTISYPWASVKDKITTVVVGKGITVLNNYAFYKCKSIRSVSLPSTLKEIAYGCFQGTSSLKRITIPAKVTKFGSQVFMDSGLKEITFLGLTPTSYGKNLFDGVTANVNYICGDAVKSFGKGLTWVKTHNFVETDGVGICSRCDLIDGALIIGITLDITEVELKPGESITLTATIDPENAAVTKLEWVSNETAIVTVTEDGVLTAVDPGSTTVVVKACDGSGVEAVCHVRVRAEEAETEPTEEAAPSQDQPTEAPQVNAPVEEPGQTEEPAGNGWILWVVIGIALLAVLLAVLLGKKKKA